MNKKEIIIILPILFLLNIALGQKTVIPKYIKEEKKNILGKWISEEDNNWKMIFTANSKCYNYYSDTLISTSIYKISNTSPQCGDTVWVDEKGETSYLELNDIKDGIKTCYEINGVSDVLSLTYLSRGNLIVLYKLIPKNHRRIKKKS